MGLVLTAVGANFEANAVAYIPPVADGLLYWGFLNDSIEKVGRNFAPNGAQASVVGTPPVDSKRAVLSGTNNIQTGTVQTPDFTMIVVANPTVDGAEQGMFISNYTSPRASGVAGTSFGVSLYTGGDDVLAGTFGPRLNVSSYSGVANSSSNLHNAILPPADITVPAFLVGTFSSTEKVVMLRNLTNGTSAQASAFTESVDIGASAYKIGAAPLNTYINKDKNFYFAAIYNRKLAESEIQLIYTRIKSYLGGRGVVI